MLWPHLLEWCAGSLGGARPGRRLTFFAAALALALAGLALGLRFGVRLPALLPGAALLALGIAAVQGVTQAREALWRAACLGLADARQRPERSGEIWLLPPTARALWNLAGAIDAMRRGEPARAAELVTRIERARLRPEETRLFDAARALIALSLGDRRRAAQIGAAALPTGVGEIDARLGRVVLAEAWGNPTRLQAIDRAWQELGLGVALGTPLGRLASLVRLRVAPEDVEALPTTEARALGDEARALGDDAFAAELEARARARTYR